MVKVKFGSKSFDAIGVEMAHEFVDGTDRQTLNIQMSGDNSVDSMRKILINEDNTELIMIENHENSTPGSVNMQSFDGYVNLMKLAIENMHVGFDDDGVPVYESRMVIKLARRSATEIQLKKMQEVLQKAGLM